MSEYPKGCTLAIEGIAYHARERTFLPALVACFGKWKVPNEKVVAVNIFRQASHYSGTGGTYASAGRPRPNVFIKFSKVEFMEEVASYITREQVRVTCSVTGSNHRLRCRQALRDLGGKDHREDGRTSACTKYFEDCFRVMEA